MPTASYNKFNSFVADIDNGVVNLSTDQLTIALSNTLPLATNSRITDITQISYTNLSSRNVTTTSSVQTGGTYKLVCADLTLTASGTVAAFQYLILYDSTASGGVLISWYDYGSALVLTNGDSLLVDFSQVNGVFTVT